MPRPPAPPAYPPPAPTVGTSIPPAPPTAGASSILDLPQAPKIYVPNADLSSLPFNERMWSKVSPSNIGEYAACPLRLVLDTEYPREEDKRWEDIQNFGKVAHWKAQECLKAPPPERLTDWQLISAQRCTDWYPRGTKKDDRPDFTAHVANVAAQAAALVTTYSPGVSRWVSEQSSYKLALMPKRRGRKGELKGFGGSIDVLAFNRTFLWDFKFVGADKVPPPRLGPDDSSDPKIKNEYLWQIASYHITENVRHCGIVWVARDGSCSSSICLDFDEPQNKQLAEGVLRFIDFIQYANFPKLAWPSRGKNCDYCEHKKHKRCPAWAVDFASAGPRTSGVKLNRPSTLLAALASRQQAPRLL